MDILLKLPILDIFLLIGLIIGLFTGLHNGVIRKSFRLGVFVIISVIAYFALVPFLTDFVEYNLLATFNLSVEIPIMGYTFICYSIHDIVLIMQNLNVDSALLGSFSHNICKALTVIIVLALVGILSVPITWVLFDCVIARFISKKDENGHEDILGVTTVKMEKNLNLSDNPCFPTVNENVLSITGILAKMNNQDENQVRVRGVGKELFKSAIKAAVEINRIEPVRLIFEVDCRNTNSLNAACRALKDLQNEGLNINMFISGYYEIKNKDKSLVEAPTFILEIDLSGAKTLSKSEVKFTYQDCKKETLFKDLSDVIKSNTNEIKSFIHPKDDKTVMYHQIKPVNALAVNLDVGSSAEGNLRVPELKALQLV